MIPIRRVLAVIKPFVALVLGAWTVPFANSTPVPLPPSAAHGWSRLPGSAEVDSFLAAIAIDSPLADLLPLGTSAGGRPILALLVSEDPEFLTAGTSRPPKITVMLIGSQHGTEPSGCEALQQAVADLTGAAGRHYLRQMNFIVIANSNPDGRDLHRRGNALRVNLSTDFTALSQPESQAVVRCLLRYRPHVLLDLHESAVLKKKSLGAAGYMTDFEMQVEVGNHPAIPAHVRSLASEVMLPRIISEARRHGLPCQRYIGEILHPDQAITHGGLSLRNLRNYASMHGTIGILIENRLDPPGDWPTPRNLKARTGKQLLAVSVCLETCARLTSRILELSDRGSPSPEGRAGPDTVALTPAYETDPLNPSITLPLIDRRLKCRVERPFLYRPIITPGPWEVPPTALYITAHHERLDRLLTLHGIPFSRLESPESVPCFRQRLVAIRRTTARNGIISTGFDVRESPITLLLPRGTMRIEPSSLSLLLLDLRSSSTIFRQPGFQDLARTGSDHFILRARAKP